MSISPCHLGGKDLLGYDHCVCVEECCNRGGYCVCPDEDRSKCTCDHPPGQDSAIKGKVLVPDTGDFLVRDGKVYRAQGDGVWVDAKATWRTRWTVVTDPEPMG